jgi:hypothetical protein
MAASQAIAGSRENVSSDRKDRKLETDKETIIVVLP